MTGRCLFSIYNINMKQFDSARNALRYLIREYKIKEIYLPYYLCDVIRHAVFAEGCKPLFYHIDDNFMPVRQFSEDSYILYPDYFGICDKNVERLVKIYPKLIVDNAHAYYAEPKGFASFNSLKKFLPEQNGAELFIGYENRNLLPDRTRREIFNKYHRQFKETNLLNIDILPDSLPFCYPYLASSIQEADNLVKSLKNLTIYRYWNPLPPAFNEYKFYSRLVPIPLTSSPTSLPAC